MTYMAGESHGGTYVPKSAAVVHKHEASQAAISPKFPQAYSENREKTNWKNAYVFARSPAPVDFRSIIVLRSRESDVNALIDEVNGLVPAAIVEVKDPGMRGRDTLLRFLESLCHLGELVRTPLSEPIVRFAEYRFVLGSEAPDVYRARQMCTPKEII